MSGMDREMVLALTATKKARKPYRVLPLAVEAPKPAEKDKATQVADALIARFSAVVTAQDYYVILDDAKTASQMQWLKDKRPELFTKVDEARLHASNTMTAAPATPPVTDEDIPY
jgi:hypothetical protein